MGASFLLNSVIVSHHESVGDANRACLIYLYEFVGVNTYLEI